MKPDNLLLADDQVYLADFGIASALEDAAGSRLTETGLTLGTPAYMSPEQAAAERRIDGRSDQYSLACVVYEMLAGEPPFSGPDGAGHHRQAPRGAGAVDRRAATLPPGARLRRDGARPGAGARRSLPDHRGLRRSTSQRHAAATPTSPVAGCPSRRPLGRPGLALTAWWLLLAGAYLVALTRERCARAAAARPDSAAVAVPRARRPGVLHSGPRRGSLSAVQLYSQADRPRFRLRAGMERTRTRLRVRAYGWGFTIPGVPSDSLLTMRPACERRSLHRRQWACQHLGGAGSRDATGDLHPHAWTCSGRCTALSQIDSTQRRCLARLCGRAGRRPTAWTAALEAWRRARAPATVVCRSGGIPCARAPLGRSASTVPPPGPTVRSRWDRPCIQAPSFRGLCRARPGRCRARRTRVRRRRAPGWAGTEHVSSLAGLAMARAAAGDRPGARRLLLTAEQRRQPAGVYPVHSVVCLAEAWGALGERDRAFAWLSASTSRWTCTSSCTCGTTRR